MKKLLDRYSSLLSDLRKAKALSEEEAAKLLAKQFGSDFPTSLKKSNSDSNNDERVAVEVADMMAAIPTFKNPSRPHAR